MDQQNQREGAQYQSGTVDQQQNDTAAAGNEAAIHSLILNNSCQP